MAQAKFPFDREFQIGILALMASRHDFMLTAVEVLEPEYFEDEILVWFYQTMRDHYLKYQEQPFIDPVVTNELLKATRSGHVKPAKLAEYAAVAKEMREPVNAQHYVINEVVRFCRRQAGRKVFIDSAPTLDTAGDTEWDAIIDQVVAAAHIGSNHLDMGTNYFAEAPERIRARLMGDSRLIIPTGITEVDLKLNGGLKSGQLGIWMGSTGGGKSIALPHCGKRAVVQGFKVAHYTLELDEDDVAERYDASWTRVPIQLLSVNTMVVRKKLDHLMSRYDGQLMIKHYPTGTASVNTIKSHLKQLASTGWHPDLLIVDYGDLLKPLTTYNDEYADLGAIFRDLRGLAGEIKVPLWTATQVNRAGMNQETTDVEHIGDSLRKAQIADVIIAICATREERENNILRLFGAKNRNGPEKWTIPIVSAYERMAFYDPVGQPPAAGNGQPTMPPTKTRRKAKNVVN